MPRHARRIAELSRDFDSQSKLTLRDGLLACAAAGAARFGFFDHVRHGGTLPQSVGRVPSAAVARAPRDEQAYPILASRIDPRGPEFRANAEANTASVEKLRAALAEATVGGGEKYTSRHKAAGKLLPRERIEMLLDRDSYFLELAPLAGNGVPGHTPGAGAIGGIGVVSGVECVIWANDSTVKGGAVSEMTAAKMGRLAEVSEQNRMPYLSMV